MSSYPQQQIPPQNEPAPTVVAASGTSSLGVQMPFLTTPIGILLLIEFLFGLIAIACGAQGTAPYAGWFMFVAILAWLTTITWFIAMFINVPEAKPNVPWLMIYLIYNGVTVFLYFIAFIVMLAMGNFHPPYVAAGVFGLFLTIAYGLSGFFTFQKTRA